MSFLILVDDDNNARILEILGLKLNLKLLYEGKVVAQQRIRIRITQQSTRPNIFAMPSLAPPEQHRAKLETPSVAKQQLTN